LRDAQITIIIPAHNQARMLDVAIASILESPLVAQAEQIMVVDDDSHDQTDEVAQQRGVTYVRVNHHNISRTRNAGLALAKTPYVAFLDHDDAWLPGNMEAQLAALQAHPKAAFAYGIARCATEELEPLPWTFPSPPLASGLDSERLHLGYPNLGVVLFRREALLRVGGFDPRILYHQDGDLMMRIAAEQEIVGVEFVGMLHRLRAPSRARADYYWPHRDVTNWSPKHARLGWKTLLRLRFNIRGLFYRRFCEDAAACIVQGRQRDALVCLWRAVWVSPERALRHVRSVGTILWRSIRVKQTTSAQAR
jgi:glycosyltransferase involved in cell wall biosynthesis